MSNPQITAYRTQERQTQLNQQLERAKQALARGEISQAQYNMFVANNRQVAPTNYQTPTSQTTPASASPLPSNPQQVTTIKDSTGVWQKKPPTPMAGPYSPALDLAGQRNPTMQEVVVPSAEVAAVGAAAIFAPEIVIPSVLIGEAANVGVSSAFKSYESGRAELVLPSSYREAADVALVSSAFGFTGSGAMSAIGKVAPRLVSEVANPVVRAATRIGVNTGVGAGGSALLSGGDPEAVIEGAAFGFGFGAFGEVAGKVGGRLGRSKVVQRINEDIVGIKFEEVTGVNEASIQAANKDIVMVNRFTQPITKTVRLRGESARYYRQFNVESLENPRLNLAGKETVTNVVSDMGVPEQVTTFEVPVKSSRVAQPLLDVMAGKDFALGKARVGKLGDMVNFVAKGQERTVRVSESGAVSGPADVAAFEEVLLKPKVGRVLGASEDKAMLVLQKKIGVSAKVDLPKLRTAKRSFDVVSVTGKLKPPKVVELPKAEVVAKPMKLLDEGKGLSLTSKLDREFEAGQKKAHADISFADYKEMTKNSGAMRVGSNDAFRKMVADKSNDLYFPDENVRVVGEGKQALEVTQKEASRQTKEVTLNRAVIRETKSTPHRVQLLPYHASRVSVVEEEETVAFSVPKAGLRFPSTITAPSLKQTMNQGAKLNNVFTQGFRPLITPKTAPTLTAKSTPVLTTKTVPKVTVKQTPSLVTTLSFPKAPKISVPKFSGFGLGGGEGKSQGDSLFGGKWFKKKHKIKTPLQMLETFGLTKSSKRANANKRKASKRIRRKRKR